MGELNPKEISALRKELSTEFTNFKFGLLRLSKELNSAIDSKSSEEDIIHAAKFISETEVLPALAELQEALSKPQQGLLKRTGGFWERTLPLLFPMTVFITVMKTGVEKIMRILVWGKPDTRKHWKGRWNSSMTI